ncbi:MAG: glycosyltransferase [Caulobacteraceae bacterium]|nr:glycosyltransferase [Caulobacteraceae bacterium]
MERQSQLAAANAARKAGDWKGAAAHLGALVTGRPDDHFLRMKHGRALLQTGDLAAAAVAFRQAVILKPERPEGHLELGRTLRLLGQNDEALRSLSQAVTLARSYVDARRELIIAGGAALLPPPPSLPSAIGPGDPVPAEAYAAFRDRFPVLPPPGEPGRLLPIQVLLDDETGDPAAVRASLLSLIEQSHTLWTAFVITNHDAPNHPLRSLAGVDSRIVFTDVDTVRGMGAIKPWWLSLSAGTVLDPEALAWMAHAAETAAPAGAYADHEVISTDWKYGRRPLRPALQPMPDADDLATTPEPPVMTLAPGADLNALIASAAREGYRKARVRLLTQAMATGPVAHIPRILSAREETEGAPVVRSDERAPVPGAETLELLVIIPTRDGGELLKTCVESLRKTALYPERIRFLLVDNGSRDPVTLSLLRGLGRRKDVDVLPVDEPFNWSRLNNLAVETRPRGELVFVNDDTGMLTPGWDVRIASHLARPEIGVVGARLLYPDGTVQHAGLALGVADGMPIHEGVRVEGGDGGPLERWRRTRAAAAVTGAFMAMRRSVFEAIGGFDAVNLAVAYNDIDLCLRVREQGLTTLYDGTVEMVHHESVSRGRNDNAVRIAWDRGELASLHQRWGEALFDDPARNPQWADDRLAPFDGFRDLSPEAAARHIRESVASPWTAVRASDRP